MVSLTEGKESQAAKNIPRLTRRERDVLAALCRPATGEAAFNEPSSIRDIAKTLGVSDAAIKQHLLHLYDKFDLFEGEDRRRLRLANIVLTAGVISRAELGDRPSGGAPQGELAAAREAIALRNWRHAYELLSAADAEGAVRDADDLEALGEAALWVGKHDQSIDARQRAYVIHAREGNVRRAAAVALALVINNVIRLQMAPAAGWLAKTRRHLAGESGCVEQGWLAMAEGLAALASGQADEGLRLAKEAFDAGARYRDPDLRALGLVFQGVALTQLGRLVEAAPFFDEAMAIATDGELGPMATGLVYCRTICACLDCFDYRRALEWTDAIDRVSLDNCTAGFHGDCRTHRASIDVIRGEWAKGESEARIASEESEHFDLSHAGIALHEVGVVRLRSGDLDGADAAFRRTVERGVNPQPGLALLQLARGDDGGSLISIRSAIGETPPGSLARARLLPAAVDIAEALGDAVEAGNAAGELAAAADKFATSALRASAAAALGVAAGMKGDTAAAVACFRQACSLWLQVDAPYEVARIRARLGAALLRLGDNVAAGMELDAAAATFRRLGAEPDARGVERLVSGGA